MSLTTIILIIALAVVILALVSLSTKSTAKGIDKAHFVNEWNDVLQASKDGKTRPMSIIHADKLLDQALKGLGYKGETMGERLISAKNKLKNKDAVWAAHKLRNRIAHETLFEPTPEDVNRALKGYQKAFKDLGVF